MLARYIDTIAINMSKGKKDLSRKILLNNTDQIYIEIPDLVYSNKLFIHIIKDNELVYVYPMVFERPICDFMLGAIDNHGVSVSVNLGSPFVKLTEIHRLYFNEDYKSVIKVESQSIIN